MFDRKAHCQQIAGLGGKATYEKYGRVHMQENGRRGLDALAQKHFDGNRVLAYKAVKYMQAQRSKQPCKFNAAELSDLQAWVKSFSGGRV